MPHDAEGNLTINGNLGIGGGTGTDVLTIQDASSSLPINYLFQNLFGAGTTNIAGLGLGGFGAGADLETIVINAGLGDDTFEIEKYLAPTTLTINAGDGNDTFEITPNSKNLAANMAAGNNILAFHGGAGYDTMGVHNDNNNNGNSYTVDGTLFRILNLIGSANFSAFLQHSSVESTTVTAGPRADTIFVNNTAAGTFYDFDGGPGAINDTYLVGYVLVPALTSVIRGGVRFNGTGGGNDTVTVNNYSDTIGRTLHIDNEFVGHVPGDNLFGPGGYLQYVGITGTMRIRLGSGDDVVYAAPNPITPILIEGNLPNASDFLGLAFAAVVNPVFTPGGTGAGTYSFDNAAPLTLNGIEATVIDDVAPFIVAQSYDETVVPTILVEFSEDVSNALSVFYLELINTTTSEPVPFGLMELNYDLGTNTASITFPGYPGGVLPPGDYSGTISGSVTDFFGNPMGIETPLLFTITNTVVDGDFNDDGNYDLLDIDALVGEIAAATHNPSFDLTADGFVDLADRDAWLAEAGAINLPSGNPYLLADANLDGVVDGQDFIAWNLNKFTAVAAWSQGDFNADGVVDGQDFILWNTNKFMASNQLAARQPTLGWGKRHLAATDILFDAMGSDAVEFQVAPRSAMS